MSNISIIAYIVLTLSIGYAFIYPSFGDVDKLMVQKQGYVDSLEMVKNIENKKNELLDKYDAISETDKKNIETVLPNSLDFVKLVSQIDAVASGYGISINQITVEEVSASVGNSIETAGPQKPYQSSIVGFSFDSTYDNFNAFTAQLEKSLRILDVRTVKIETGDKGIYKFTVEFETYWLK